MRADCFYKNKWIYLQKQKYLGASLCSISPAQYPCQKNHILPEVIPVLGAPGKTPSTAY